MPPPDPLPSSASSPDTARGADEPGAPAFRLRPGVELVEARSGPALLSWSPLRLVRVNDVLAKLLRAAVDVVPRSRADARALAALERRGVLEREPRLGAPEDRLPSVSVVIPVKDRAHALRRCLESLQRLRYPKHKLEVVVVDDGSADETPQVARSFGARVIPSGGRGRGPAAARNRGVAAARSEILAFLDSDCVASEAWLSDLVPEFEDPELAALGGRVEGLHSSSGLDRYEAAMSSLCLGAESRRAMVGDDTFYLPSCNLLVRRVAFAEAGRFRDELHIGEDVDLSWRLRDRGGAIAYAPRGSVLHEHRNRPAAFLRRRFEYGTSESLLEALHPRRRKRFVLPTTLAAATLLAAAACLATSWVPAAAAGAVLLLDALGYWLKLRREIARLPLAPVVRARLKAWGTFLYWLSFYLVRYYVPPLLLVCAAWPRFTLLACALALLPAAVDHRRRRPALAFPPFLAFYLAEHVAYSAGVFWGCLRLRSFRCYRPVFFWSSS